MGSGRLALLRRRPGAWTPILSLVLVLGHPFGAPTLGGQAPQNAAPSAAGAYTHKDTLAIVASVEAAANEVRLHGLSLIHI